MKGHSIAKEMESWWKDHGGKHNDAEWADFLSDFSYLLSRKLDEQSQEHSNAGRFGMSKAGGCTRAAILKLRGEDEAEKSGSSRVTFWNGHMAEVLGLATLRACGYAVRASTTDAVQWIARIDPYMLSYSDGVMFANEKWGEKTIIGVKSVGYKMSGRQKGGWKRYGFAQYPFDGVRKTNPGYWAQAQAEMYGSNCRSFLFLLVAKDMIKAMEQDPYLGPEGNGSLSFYAELIERDDEFCEKQLEPTWAAAWEAHASGEIGPAKALSTGGGYVSLDPSDADGNKQRCNIGFSFCDYCDFRNACEGAILQSQLSKSLEIARANA